MISVELTELYDRVVGNNDGVEEIQLDLTVHQHRIPAWNESLLMFMSDALLRALQRWITSHSYSMKTRCFISLQGVECIVLPVNKMFGCVNQYSSPGGAGGGDKVWDRETMVSQLAKRLPCVVVSG